MKVALVYDRVNKWGGAERVLQALGELFPDAPLYTSVYDEKRATWAKSFDVRPSFLQKIPFTKSNHEFIPFMMPVAFEQFSFDKYDLVISLTSESAKGVITKPETKHISYILTPTRYLWSGYKDYLNTRFKRLAAQPFTRYLRKWDKIAAHRPDFFVSISKEVQKRLKNYYGQESSVIYPPSSLIDDVDNKAISEKRGSFYLVVSRFVPYKKIDLAIQACNLLKHPLKIIGSGRDEGMLRKIAGPTIEFLGKVNDDKLVEYYKKCKALIFPGVEDFGLTVVEAQHFGAPIIAFRGGGALETIIEGKTGCFFEQPNRESLVGVLRKYDSYQFNPKAAMQNAQNFSKKNFKANFQSMVNSLF